MINKEIQKIIEQCLDKNPCKVDIRYNEPMKEHTTFKTGGPADCWLSPCGEGFVSFCASLLNCSRRAGIPVFVLGGGANIVVSDRGIRGIVLDINAWNGALCANEEEFILKSGTGIDQAANIAAAAGLAGLEFLAGMPGTIGGALWMNARCYGSEIADVLKWAEIIAGEQGTGSEYKIKRVNNEQCAGFGYKQSPFQNMDCLIVTASFGLKTGNTEKILLEMDKNKKDRNEKGHYLFPCAGSAFKNNRDFGKPAGQIIDEAGLKGLKKGGAQIAPFHGNIIINTGNAAAADIRCLVDEAAARIKAATGFVLEPEILFVGEW